MAALSITLTGIATDADGRIRVRFGKREYEFQNLDIAKAFVADSLSRETLELIALKIAIDRAPANPQSLAGHAVTVDTSLASWGKVA